VFLSHHQYASAFDVPSLATPKQLAPLLPPSEWFAQLVV
jgi:hypothetical protein